VDHTTTNQSSILSFVEDNWHLGRVSGSFDSVAGSLNRLFDFDGRRFGPPPHDRFLFLNPTTGQPMELGH
jgi:phospholipase C